MPGPPERTLAPQAALAAPGDVRPRRRRDQRPHARGVGKILRVSCERVRHIEAEALRSSTRGSGRWRRWRSGRCAGSVPRCVPDYPDWRSYWADVEPRLAAEVAAQRNPQTVAALSDAVGLCGFVTEKPVSKVTRHAPEHLKLAPLILEQVDVLRGIRAAYDAQTVAALAVSLRTAFELRCGIVFVAKSGEVSKHADLFERFAHVERMRFARTDPAKTKDPAELEAIARQKAPEWFDPTSGKLLARSHWTGPRRTILDVAKEAGLEQDYRTVYASTSMIAHGSYLVRNLYERPEAFRLVATREKCDQMAILGASNSLDALGEWCELFGIAYPRMDLVLIRRALLVAGGMQV